MNEYLVISSVFLSDLGYDDVIFVVYDTILEIPVFRCFNETDAINICNVLNNCVGDCYGGDSATNEISKFVKNICDDIGKEIIQRYKMKQKKGEEKNEGN